MADYPEWVLAHKKKGTYINRVGDKYYLYAAHSERVPGTNKVKRVHDGYIGRITERDGLIPTRDKARGTVIVYEYGLCVTLLSLCDRVHKGLRREFRGAADWILVAGLLTVAYGDYLQDTYQWSFLSVRFPGLDMGKTLTDKQRFGLTRCVRMVTDVSLSRFGENTPTVVARLTRICKVSVNGQLYAPELSATMKEWLNLQGIDWGGWFGES